MSSKSPTRYGTKGNIIQITSSETEATRKEEKTYMLRITRSITFTNIVIDLLSLIW